MLSFIRVCLVLVTTVGTASLAQAQVDPLPSWNEGKAKSAILDFVARVTKEGGPDYVRPAERIACFDNDGTLWPENPVPFEIAFSFDRIKAEAPKHPEWKQKQPYKAVLEGDVKTLVALGKEGLVEVLLATHTGMTVEQFNQAAYEWAQTAKHPRFNRRYIDLTYQPMQEVLRYLRANSFKTFIVSGGTADFMRAWSEEVYAIPPEQVVGTRFKTEFTMTDDRPEVRILRGEIFIDDKAGKPVGIHQVIGRRPIATFGNSDGDLEMLQWTTIDRKPSFGLIVHHTDAKREWAYDKNPKSSGKLVEGLIEAPKRGWIVVDMKNDWKTIFSVPK